jgi:hypothetical protein
LKEKEKMIPGTGGFLGGYNQDVLTAQVSDDLYL